ncbi:ubiquitin-protein ligase peroxin 12 [Martiniozyma asiatica (nom. inval.)]|nr:ubiquitin-protein ligase peroxin 12 [Martiniozyma asiatica]
METSVDASRLGLLKRPTILETVACSELEALVAPSLRFLLAHYTHRYPRRLLPILNRFDEIYLAVGTAVEGLYLMLWNSGMIEKFYGIKRTNKFMVELDNGSGRRSRLTRLQIVLSICEKIWMPYVQNKLDDYHQRLMPQLLLNQFGRSWKDQMRRLFLRVYPVLKMVLKLIQTALTVLYLADKTTSTTLLGYLANISLERLNQYDHRQVEKHQSNFVKSLVPQLAAATPDSSSVAQLAKVAVDTLTPIYTFAWKTTDVLLPAGIFLLKFAEWYQHSRPKETNKTSEILVAAPGGGTAATTEGDLCRLCHERIHNPGVIETGYVFCYRCIYEHLRDASREDGGRCPVTGRTLLGCTYSPPKGEWVVRGIRRLIL